MNFKKDHMIYEGIEANLRASIPFISKNIYRSLNEWTFTEKLGLLTKQVHHSVLDAAHRLNMAANYSAKKNAQRIRDELLTSHYSRELSISPKNIKNIQALPPKHPERISLEAKIKTLGTLNPTIGSLQKLSSQTIKNYSDKIGKSSIALKSPRSPAHMANLYKYLRKRPGIQKAIKP